MEKRRETSQRIRKYEKQSLHYLANAFKTMEAGDMEKAGESLWGSMAEALKAAAMSKGIYLKHHAQIGQYARDLAKELNDKSIWDAFGHASYLHSNFFEIRLSAEEMALYAEDIRAAVGRLLSFIPEEAGEGMG